MSKFWTIFNFVVAGMYLIIAMIEYKMGLDLWAFVCAVMFFVWLYFGMAGYMQDLKKQECECKKK